MEFYLSDAFNPEEALIVTDIETRLTKIEVKRQKGFAGRLVIDPPAMNVECIQEEEENVRGHRERFDRKLRGKQNSRADVRNHRNR